MLGSIFGKLGENPIMLGHIFRKLQEFWQSIEMYSETYIFPYTQIEIHNKSHTNLMKLMSTCLHMLLECTTTKVMEHSNLREAGGKGGSL